MCVVDDFRHERDGSGCELFQAHRERGVGELDISIADVTRERASVDPMCLCGRQCRVNAAVPTRGREMLLRAAGKVMALADQEYRCDGMGVPSKATTACSSRYWKPDEQELYGTGTL